MARAPAAEARQRGAGAGGGAGGQVGINTPVTRDGPSAVRGPHYDRLSELFAGLLYFRHPDDTSSGGDLQARQPRALRS